MMTPLMPLPQLPTSLTLASTPLEEFLFRNTGRTGIANRVDADFMFILWVSVASFVLLMALMVYFVMKYRRRPGVAPERSPSHHTALEVTWTVVPTIFLAIMFFRGFWVYVEHVVAPGDSIELVASAKKWVWDVTYPGGVQSTETTRIGAVDIPVLYIPAELPVKVRMSSADVMHAFYVPDFRVKFDVFPNRYTSLWFKSEPPTGEKTIESGPLAGTPYEDHWLFCAEYCGESHAEMAAIIRTVPASAYFKWYNDTRDGVGMEPLRLGQILYTTKGCVACHSVDGAKNTGPTWKDLFGKSHEMADGSVVVADENYIRESILVPAAKIVKGYPNQMPSYQGQLNEKQLEALILYMKSISVNTPAGQQPPAPAATPDGAPAPADAATTPPTS